MASSTSTDSSPQVGQQAHARNGHDVTGVLAEADDVDHSDSPAVEIAAEEEEEEEEDEPTKLGNMSPNDFQTYLKRLNDPERCKHAKEMRKRGKNRQASERARKKRQVEAPQIEDELRDAQLQNTRLREEVAALERELQHDQEQLEAEHQQFETARMEQELRSTVADEE